MKRPDLERILKACVTSVSHRLTTMQVGQIANYALHLEEGLKNALDKFQIEGDADLLVWMLKKTLGGKDEG